MDVSEENFIQQIRALGFVLNAQGELVWEGDADILLRPLKTNGGALSSGYRFVYVGNRLADCIAVIQLLLTMYPKAQVTGVECLVEDTVQNLLIQRAERSNYMRGSMNGIYHAKQVGIVCMPNQLVLHVRRRIVKHQLDSIMSEVTNVKDDLIGEKFDLFTFESDGSGLMFA